MISKKDHFSLPDEVAYLNCAYMSPLLKRTEKIGKEGVTSKALPYMISPQDFFTGVTKLKNTFSKLINAGDPDRIAIIPSVSYGMANVANNVKLKKGDNIVLTGAQFPSNYYPWKKLAEKEEVALELVAAPDSLSKSEAWTEAIMETINDRTALVAVGNIHWADGTPFDLKKLREKTSSCGALLVIDGTQSVGALPFNVQEIQPDALICAGYKWLLGPYSIGCAYYGPYFDNGEPIEENWINRLESDNFRTLISYQESHRPKANKYSVGEQSNFILVPMMVSGLEQILDWGVNNIQAYCKKLSYQPVAQLKELGIRVADERVRCGHLFGLQVGREFDMEILLRTLEEEKVYVSVRGDSIRVAPHLYNEEKDFDRLINCFVQSRKKALF